MLNYTDFYVIGPDDPNYNDTYIIEDDIISVIIQKYKMLIFTDQGDILGNPLFGANLEYLLYETKVSEKFVTEAIIDQINQYIPELIGMNYSLQVAFAQNPDSFQDILFIYFSIADFQVYAQFGKSIT